MSHAAKMSLKAFWEAVERRLAACSTDDLCAILRAMARETPPSERRTFLEKLDQVGATGDAAREALRREELLSDIEQLAEQLRSALAEAEPWQDRYDWYDGAREDSLGPVAEFVEPLGELFDRTEAAFDYGYLSLARSAYRELFEVLGIEDDYGRGVRFHHLSGVDAGEAYARYLRAVYECEPPECRPQVLYAQMRLVRIGLMRPRPTLDDLIQVSPQPLPDRERFFADWITFLHTQEEGAADALLREGVRLSQGTPGLEALARAEGRTRPYAYLDWCAALAEEGRPREVLLAGQEALRTLPWGLFVRAAIADHLCIAAAQLNERAALRDGRWEAFVVQPTLARLLDLRDTAPETVERTALMRQVAEHVRSHRTRPPDYRIALLWDTDDGEREIWVVRPVVAHAYLLAGEYDAARRLVGNQKVLGWSSSSCCGQGLVVGFHLVLLSQRTLDELPPNLARVWRWALEYSADCWSDAEENAVQKRLQRAYAEQLAHPPVSGYRPESALSWCLRIVQRRVNAIVGGQKRGAYDKAAVLTVACAETLRLRGDLAVAEALIQEIRDRFPRHSAFQRELQGALHWKEP